MQRSATSGTCTTTTITNWVKTMSAYIKSLDCNHLVGLGDEGWFNWSNSTDYAYECANYKPSAEEEYLLNCLPLVVVRVSTSTPT
jgi:endo-1,4-beta-mannosidase